VVVALALVLGAVVSGQDRPAAPSGPGIQFENVTAASGIDFTHVNGSSPERQLYEIMGSGGLFFDYDADGWLDLVLIDGGSLTDPAVAKKARHRLYRNRGNGTFADVTASSGLINRDYGMGACSADYDNDGWPDLYITSVGNSAVSNTLYRNNAGRGFAEVTRAAGAIGSGPVFSASCAFADVDADGDVDLFVANYVDARPGNNIFCGDTARKVRIYCHPINFAPLADVLYRNNGNGTFTNASVEAGITADRGNGLGAVFGDYDDDGRIDLFVANDTTPNFLYHNEGRGTFRESALLSGVAVAADGRPRAGMGTDFGDYDGDGRLDLFVTNHELESHTLFRNLGKGLFEDATSRSGVGVATLPYVGFGTLFIDVDHDGDVDLPIVNGHVMNSPSHFRAGATEAQRKLLLRNDAGRFTEIGRQSGPGFGVDRIGRTLAAGDIDNDGDLDLLVTNNGGPAELLRHGSGGGSSLLVRLVGTRSNRSGIGARLRITSGTATQIREVKAGSGYLGQSDLRVHAGLGSSKSAERVEVRWPSGGVEMLNNVAAGQILTVTEGKGVTARTPFSR
jgi:hypothetical protein